MESIHPPDVVVIDESRLLTRRRKRSNKKPCNTSSSDEEGQQQNPITDMNDEPLIISIDEPSALLGFDGQYNVENSTRTTVNYEECDEGDPPLILPGCVTSPTSTPEDSGNDDDCRSAATNSSSCSPLSSSPNSPIFHKVSSDSSSYGNEEFGCPDSPQILNRATSARHHYRESELVRTPPRRFRMSTDALDYSFSSTNNNLLLLSASPSSYHSRSSSRSAALRRHDRLSAVTAGATPISRCNSRSSDNVSEHEYHDKENDAVVQDGGKNNELEVPCLDMKSAKENDIHDSRSCASSPKAPTNHPYGSDALRCTSMSESGHIPMSSPAVSSPPSSNPIATGNSSWQSMVVSQDRQTTQQQQKRRTSRLLFEDEDEMPDDERITDRSFNASNDSIMPTDPHSRNQVEQFPSTSSFLTELTKSVAVVTPLSSCSSSSSSTDDVIANAVERLAILATPDEPKREHAVTDFGRAISSEQKSMALSSPMILSDLATANGKMSKISNGWEQWQQLKNKRRQQHATFTATSTSTCTPMTAAYSAAAVSSRLESSTALASHGLKQHHPQRKPMASTRDSSDSMQTAEESGDIPMLSPQVCKSKSTACAETGNTVCATPQIKYPPVGSNAGELSSPSATSSPFSNCTSASDRTSSTCTTLCISNRSNSVDDVDDHSASRRENIIETRSEYVRGRPGPVNTTQNLEDLNKNSDSKPDHSTTEPMVVAKAEPMTACRSEDDSQVALRILARLDRHELEEVNEASLPAGESIVKQIGKSSSEMDQLLLPTLLADEEDYHHVEDSSLSPVGTPQASPRRAASTDYSPVPGTIGTPVADMSVIETSVDGSKCTLADGEGKCERETRNRITTLNSRSASRDEIMTPTVDQSWTQENYDVLDVLKMKPAVSKQEHNEIFVPSLDRDDFTARIQEAPCSRAEDESLEPTDENFYECDSFEDTDDPSANIPALPDIESDPDLEAPSSNTSTSVDISDDEFAKAGGTRSSSSGFWMMQELAVRQSPFLPQSESHGEKSRRSEAKCRAEETLPQSPDRMPAESLVTKSTPVANEVTSPPLSGPTFDRTPSASAVLRNDKEPTAASLEKSRTKMVDASSWDTPVKSTFNRPAAEFDAPPRRVETTCNEAHHRCKIYSSPLEEMKQHLDSQGELTNRYKSGYGATPEPAFDPFAPDEGDAKLEWSIHDNSCHLRTDHHTTGKRPSFNGRDVDVIPVQQERKSEMIISPVARLHHADQELMTNKGMDVSTLQQSSLISPFIRQGPSCTLPRSNQYDSECSKSSCDSSVRSSIGGDSATCELLSLAATTPDLLNGNASKPILVQSLDCHVGIPKGDIMICLLDQSEQHPADPIDPSSSNSTTCAHRLYNAIWRGRTMRQHSDTKWMTDKLLRQAALLSASMMSANSVKSTPSLPSRGRSSVRIDLDDCRVVGGSMIETEKSAMQHLKYDDFDDATTLYEDILESYNQYFVAKLKANEVVAAGSEGGTGDDSIDNAERLAVDLNTFKLFIAAGLHNIGILHLLRGNHNRALPYFERATMNRASTTRSMGFDVAAADHISSLVRMAMCRFALEEFGEAHAQLEEALSLSRDLIGDGTPANNSGVSSLSDHCVLAEILNNLGCLSYFAGNVEQACELLQESLQVHSWCWEESLYASSSTNKFANHSVALNMSVTQANIGFLTMSCSRDFATSLASLEAAVKQQEMLLRDAHPTLICTMDHLVVANLLAERKDKAIQLLHRMLSLQKDAFGNNDSRIVATESKLAMIQGSSPAPPTKCATRFDAAKARNVDDCLPETSSRYQDATPKSSVSDDRSQPVVKTPSSGDSSIQGRFFSFRGLRGRK